uniref:Uncharacterized protein n=1 Tax=Romanomermis culicivorax TaxID=13658 RepID=A0A915HJV6_ROMCU
IFCVHISQVFCKCFSVAHKKGRRILAEKISLLISNFVDESEPKMPIESDNAKRHPNLLNPKPSTPCHSQPLFSSEEGPFNIESQIASSVNSTEQDHFSREDFFSTNNNQQSIANPFKRNFPKSADDTDPSSTRSIFDNVDLISSKKRSSISGKHEGGDMSFDVEPKRQKTLMLKKQAKLTFAKKLDEFKMDP